MAFRIFLDKENFKFSCSHFTIFSATSAERLHGHNYYVSTQFKLRSIADDIGMAFDFGAIKPLVRRLVDGLDERVLVPTRSPHLSIADQGESLKIQFAKKTYVLPKDDIYLLPIANITSEELARWLAHSLGHSLRDAGLAKDVESLSVGVQETRGQSVVFELSLS